MSYQTPDQRLAAEFNWNKYTEETPKHDIPVAFPTWLAREDRPKVLAMVDLYADKTIELYPWAGDNFDFSSYTVWIHDNPGGFVAGSPDSNCWALGWQLGDICAVCWGLATDWRRYPVGPATQNILPALIHEWFHAIFQERYAWADPGHYMYYPMPEVRHCLRTAQVFFDNLAPPLMLSDESLWRALHYKYHPWIYPAKFA
jgi:hypothetical protein